MNKSAEEKIHSYIGWEKESAYEPWQFIDLLPLFDPLRHDIIENKASDGQSNQQGRWIHQDVPKVQIRDHDTSTACQRWREQHVGTEEDGHQHRSEYGPECVEHHMKNSN